MKSNQPIKVFLALTALASFIGLPTARAAVRTWSGAGADANWNTAANWGGTAPVSADTLVFSGTTQQNNTNNISSLSVNALSFANGGFTLNGNLMSVNGPLTNSAGVDIFAQGVNVTAQNQTWNIAPGSELRIAGQFTNSTTANPLATLAFGGTVRFTSTNCLPNRFFTLTSGSVIADGCNLTTLDGFRVQPPTGSSAVFQITNNASFTIGSGGNLRLCQTATGGTSRVDVVSGVLNMAINTGPGAGDIFVGEAANTTTVFNQNGGLVEFTGNGNNRIAFANASATANGTYNLNGGTLWTAQIVQVNAGSPGGTFNFNGGTLKPTVNSATFFQGVQMANIQAGGAVIDTTILNITIGQSLSGVGGLTKLGSGTLTLTGNNAYTGATVVSNGTLVTSASSFLGAGVLTVASNANLTITNFSGTALLASTLNLGSSVTNSVTINLGSSPAPGGNPVLAVTNLNGTGTALINILGSSFASGSYPLIAYTNGTGLASIKLGSLPLGVSGTLVQSGNVLSLNVAYVPRNLEWSGNASSNWDTSAINWYDLNNGNNPVSYFQSGGNGDAVTFDDNGGANPNINLGIAVTPSQLTFNNNGVAYTFSGSGSISGGVSLVKGGFQSVTLGTVNTYSGGTTLNAGTIYIASNQALGTGAATLNLGTLASDSVSGRTLANSIVQNADTGVILGDSVNTGMLTLAGTLDLGGGAGRTLNFNSDVVVSGALTNGGIASKTGPGALIIKGNATQTALGSQNNGNIIVDGGTFTSLDGWRMQSLSAGATLLLAVTNGGVFNVGIFSNTANLRIGLAGGDNSANHILDISGTVNLAPTSATVNGNNAVSLGLSGANDILNLRIGGLLATRSLFGASPGNTEAHFMGGTMRAIANDAGFITGLTNAFMENGGLIVDTTNFSVTIAQPLLASGNGGLTKLGAGTLTLTGANTYTGTTAVNAGKLVLAPNSAAPGSFTVASGATLAMLASAPGTNTAVPSVSASGGSSIEAEFSGLTNNPTTPAGGITNLVLGGTVGVNVVSGTIKIGQFPLFSYGTISGAGRLVVGTLPTGVVGNIVTNTPNKSIDLVVSSVTPLVWLAATNADWNTTSQNWRLSGNPAVYAQGDNVLFNDAASNSTVNLSISLSPGGMTVSNNTSPYTFNITGSGSLGGSMSLVKDGTNTLTMNSANTYLGTTTIKAGEFVAGNATALGGGTGTATVQSGATLEVGGNNLGLQPVVVGGGGLGGTGALANSGPDQNNVLRSVTLTANTTIRADALFGIRMPAETDLGFIGNGHALTKIGTGRLNLNGGQANVSGTTVWDSDLGDVFVQQGTLSFERRMTMGRNTNTVYVWPGATLQLFALNNAVLPLQTKPVQLTNATFQADGNVAADGSQFGGLVTVNGPSNTLATVAGVALTLQGAVGGAGSLTYSGNGVISLQAANTYTGGSVVASGTLQLAAGGSIPGTPAVIVQSNAVFDVIQVSPWTLGTAQTLGGNGTVLGNVVANGTIAPGSSIGTFTISGDLTINGNLAFEVDKSQTQSNDLAVVSGALSNTGSGILSVSNLGPALVVGDKFTLFSQPVSSGGAITVTGGGATWTNNLAVDGSITVTSVISTGPTNAEPITIVSSGGNLNLSWPTKGWRLQVQTNSLATGLRTNWFDWPNATTTNAVSIPVSASNPSVFFRLVYP